MACLCGLMSLACCGAKMAGAAVLSVLGSALSGVGVGLAVVAGGFAVASAWTSGAVVAVATAIVAFVAIKMVVRCVCR